MENKASFSFGTGIAIAYSGFVIFMLGLVYLCVKQTDMHLVTDQYYQEELVYQNRIDQMENARKLSVLPEITVDQAQATLTFPAESEQASGQVKFYRPSDPTADFEVPFLVQDKAVRLELPPQMAKGLWNAEISWEKAGVTYYYMQKFQK